MQNYTGILDISCLHIIKKGFRSGFIIMFPLFLKCMRRCLVWCYIYIYSYFLDSHIFKLKLNCLKWVILLQTHILFFFFIKPESWLQPIPIYLYKKNAAFHFGLAILKFKFKNLYFYLLLRRVRAERELSRHLWSFKRTYWANRMQFSSVFWWHIPNTWNSVFI